MKKIIVSICLFFFLTINVYADKETVIFNKCIDGDTFSIILNDEIRSVRMLAVNTPETIKTDDGPEPYGKEASDFTCDKLTNAKKVELEYDSGSNKTDKYGRILAWVYVDGELIQKELINNGYAKVAYIYGKYMYTDELYELEDIAKNDKLGLWSIDTSTENSDEDKAEDITQSFKEELKNLIKEYVEDLAKDLLSDIKKYIKKKVKKLFK